MKTIIPKPIFNSDVGKDLYYDSYDKALALWPIPFESRYIPTRFGPTHIIAAGDIQKKPIVLFHSAQASSTMWFPNVEGLASRFRVYAVDFILEVGKSHLEKEMQTRADLADWLMDVLDGCGLESPDIIGISRGAWNAVAFALQRPDRVGKLVLLSPAQTFMAITNIGFLLATLRCSFLPSERAIQALSNKVFWNPAGVPKLFLQQYALGLRYFNLLNGIHVPPTLFSDDELRALQTPCMLMIGDHDVINTQMAVARAKSLVSDIETETVKEAGHILTMDQPGHVHGRIIDFLT